MCEVGLTLTEIRYMILYMRSFAHEHQVKTPLVQFPSLSFQKPAPYGNVLIMSPWNYPFLLTMESLAGAITAGNPAIIKPIAYSPATSEMPFGGVGESGMGDYRGKAGFSLLPYKIHRRQKDLAGSAHAVSALSKQPVRKIAAHFLEIKEFPYE